MLKLTTGDNMIKINNSEKISKIYLNSNGMKAISSEGKIFYVWKLSRYGELDIKAFYESKTLKELDVSFIDNDSIDSLSLGGYHYSLLSLSGKVFTWGDNHYGQLGDGTFEGQSVPTEITHMFNLANGDKIINLALGINHSSALSLNGKVFTWGDNTDGQLGEGISARKSEPTEINYRFNLANGDKIINLALGSMHSSALSLNGRVFTWGHNKYGQLGNGSTVGESVPTEITSEFNLANGDKIINLVLGLVHSSALSLNGRVFTWGNNVDGQLGDATNNQRNTPTEITHRFNLANGDKIINLALGEYHSSALSLNGRVFVLGKTVDGRLADRDDTNNERKTPYEITSRFSLAAVDKFVSISHSSASSSNGRIFTWGISHKYDYKTKLEKTVPNEITSRFSLAAGDRISAISIRSYRYAALNSNGHVFNCRFSYSEAQLPTVMNFFQHKLDAVDKIVSISLGEDHSSALSSNGRVFTWGENEYGQLGDGTTEIIFDPSLIDSIDPPTEVTSRFGLSAGDKIVSISLGGDHSSAISSTGRVFTWGYNEYGQLGDNTITNKSVPTEITSRFGLSTGDKIVSISLGSTHSSALSLNGRVFTWGINRNGQLGNGSTVDKSVPTEITSRFSLTAPNKIVSISLGVWHSSALSSNGRVFTWGLNNYYQLGDATNNQRNTPTEITSEFNLANGDKIINLALGDFHSSALSSNGRVFTWGNTDFLKFWDETKEDKSLPTEITSRFNLTKEEK
jgi:alpha-tubulin suppressor-like RCC1 family protein